MVKVIDIKYIGPPIFRAYNVYSFHGKNYRDLIVPCEIEYREQYNNEIRRRKPLEKIRKQRKKIITFVDIYSRRQNSNKRYDIIPYLMYRLTNISTYCFILNVRGGTFLSFDCPFKNIYINRKPLIKKYVSTENVPLARICAATVSLNA